MERDLQLDAIMVDTLAVHEREEFVKEMVDEFADLFGFSEGADKTSELFTQYMELAPSKKVMLIPGRHEGCLAAFLVLSLYDIEGDVFVNGFGMVKPDWNGSRAWSLALRRAMPKVFEVVGPDAGLYWIGSKVNPKAYSMQLRKFPHTYPRPGATFPEDLKRRRDKAAGAIWPREYDPVRGVIVRPQRGNAVRRLPTEGRTDGDTTFEFYKRLAPNFADDKTAMGLVTITALRERDHIASKL